LQRCPHFAARCSTGNKLDASCCADIVTLLQTCQALRSLFISGNNLTMQDTDNVARAIAYHPALKEASYVYLIISSTIISYDSLIEV
jgi:hypothetical protein